MMPTPTIPPMTPRTMAVVWDLVSGVGVGPGAGPLPGRLAWKVELKADPSLSVMVTVTDPLYPASVVSEQLMA